MKSLPTGSRTISHSPMPLMSLMIYYMHQNLSSRNQKHEPFSNFSHVLHQILKLLKPPMQHPQTITNLWFFLCASSNTKSTEVLSWIIHKHGPVPYLSQFLHQILNIPKNPFMQFSQLWTIILFTSSSSSDTKSTEISSCIIHKQDQFYVPNQNLLIQLL